MINPNSYIKKVDIINLLISEGYIKEYLGYKLAERIKPSHGNCCTCQTCGQGHDDCVCDHNRWIENIENLTSIIVPPNSISLSKDYAEELNEEITSLLDEIQDYKFKVKNNE